MRYLLIILLLCMPMAYAMEPDNATEESSLMSHDDMVLAALALIGSPYKYGGSSPEVGFDCSGLVKYVLGLTSRITLPRSSAEMYQSGGRSIALDELKTGDLIFFKIGKSKRINHVAVYLGEQRFVHAPSTGKTVSVDKMDSPYWRRYLVGARRVLPENDLSPAEDTSLTTAVR